MSEQSSTTSMTPRLLAFLHGRRSLAELPDALELPTALWQQMNQLWQHSVSKIEQGVVQEWGGLLVLDEQIGLKLVNIVSGDAYQLRLQFAAHEDFVGSFHTHPSTFGWLGDRLQSDGSRKLREPR